MTPKGFIAGCFLLGGLAFTLLGFGRNPIIFGIGVLAAIGGGITLWRMRKIKIDPTK